MTIDPTRNMVVFLLVRGEGKQAIAEAPTLAEDGIQQAWAQVAREHDAQPAEVVALHSEWGTSAADAQFIRAHFPDAKVTYNFSRPGAGGWDEALQAARQVMAESHEMKESEETAARIQQVTEEGELLPVLWSASAVLSAVPHWPLVPGRLFVAFATVAPTPRGTIGMSHLTHDAHRRLGSPALDDLMGQASAALTKGLQVEGRSTNNGDLITLHREGGLAASVLALPDFYLRMSGTLKDDRLVVGLPCPDELIVAGVNSDWTEEIKQMVFTSSHTDAQLVPSVLLVESSGMRIIAERN